MKVVIISASPNEIGLTNSCVNVCMETLKKENIETEWIWLNTYNLKCQRYLNKAVKAIRKQENFS